MRIAILASNLERIPPEPPYLNDKHTSAAAPEAIMFRICEGMVRRGHDVTLYASGDSKTSAKIISVTKMASSINPHIGIENHQPYEYVLISRCYQDALENKYDIIHSTFDCKSAYFAPFAKIPTISTMHSPLDGITLDILKLIKNTQYYVSISEAQRRPLPDLNYVATVYNGIDINLFSKFKLPAQNRLLFVGRFTHEKGLSLAIDASKELDIPIDIIGRKETSTDYWDKEIKPRMDPKLANFKGYIKNEELGSCYAQARGFLAPVLWEEPFGLTMVESMASGTPVIAFARGSSPELIKDGETGFLVNYSSEHIRGNWIIKELGFHGLVEALRLLRDMPEREYLAMREKCRQHAMANFSTERMVTGYEEVYKEVLSRFHQL